MVAAPAGAVVAADGAVVAGDVSGADEGAVVSGTSVSIGTVVVGVSSSLLKAPPIHAISTTAATAAIATITQRTALRLTALVRAAFASSA